MHGKRNLEKILREKSQRVPRTARTLNQPVVKIGDWVLEEDAQGNLLAHNVDTGVSTILSFKGPLEGVDAE